MILWLFLAAVLLLQLGDVLTTNAVLKLGGREANPVMAWLIDRLGFWPTMALKVAAVTSASLLLFVLPDPLFLIGGAALAAFMNWVIWHNRQILIRLQVRDEMAKAVSSATAQIRARATLASGIANIYRNADDAPGSGLDTDFDGLSLAEIRELNRSFTVALDTDFPGASSIPLCAGHDAGTRA